MLYLFNVIFLESYPQLARELTVQLIPAGDGSTKEVACVTVQEGLLLIIVGKVLPCLLYEGKFTLSLVQEILLTVLYVLTTVVPSDGCQTVCLTVMPEGGIVTQTVLTADVQHGGQGSVACKDREAG